MNNTTTMLPPQEFEKHPLHNQCFLSQDEKLKTTNYHESIEKYGKIKSVVYIEVDSKKLVIDGWSYVCYAINNSIPLVPATKVDVVDDEDILRLMLELQFSDHNSAVEEYRIYRQAYTILWKGKGYRSDLGDDEPSQEIDSEEKKKRRQNIYEKIANITAASSAKRVQYILKIGKINPLYLEYMDEQKASLNAAYYSCVSEEKKDLPTVPKVKTIQWVRTLTEVPIFSTPTKTDELLSDIIDDKDLSGCENDDSMPFPYEGELSGKSAGDYDVDFIEVVAYCTGCNKETTVKLKLTTINELWKVKN